MLRDRCPDEHDAQARLEQISEHCGRDSARSGLSRRAARAVARRLRGLEPESALRGGLARAPLAVAPSEPAEVPGPAAPPLYRPAPSELGASWHLEQQPADDR